ncbi:MAG TPA: hypothetical protein ENK43_07350 [Planctomycetes bacterium]|nr:hypothetical protein [Planctomycetota bacterium]
MTKAQSITSAFGFLILLGGILGFDVAHDVPKDALRENPPTVDGFLDGSWAEDVDAFFHEKSAFMRATRPYRNGWMLKYLGETPSRIVAGRDGWLFLLESFQPMAEPGHTRKWFEMFTLAEGIRQAFVGPRTRFLVLVMPAKWRLYPEFMPDYEIVPGRRALYGAVLAELHRRGMATVDLLSILKERKAADPGALLFPPNDTHFTERGFALVAAVVAEKLCGVPAHQATRRLERSPRMCRRFPGDLPRQLSLDPKTVVGNSFAFQEEAYELEPCFDADGADVLVLGDSFFLAHDGVFQRLIQRATGKKVDSRFAGWRKADVARLRAVYGRNPPPYVLLAVTERRFEGY